MDQLQAIRVFARVYESGGFRKAADSLGIPKATVSKHIRDLEAHLGVKLLQRTTRSLKATPDGAAYYERAAHLVREIDDIDSSFGSANAQPRGRIKVAVLASLATQFIVPALADFHERYPDIAIELDVSDRPVDIFREDADCVIRGGVLNHPAMIARLIGSASWVTCATPAYLEQYGVPTHPSQLRSDHKLINYVAAGTGRVLPSPFGKGAGLIEIEGTAFVGVNDSNAHVAAGLAGLGLIHTFDYSVRDHLVSGRLVAVLRDWAPEPFPIYVVYAANRHMSQRTRVFIDWLIGRFVEFA